MASNAELPGVRPRIWGLVLLAFISTFVFTRLAPARPKNGTSSDLSHELESARHHHANRLYSRAAASLNDSAEVQKTVILQRLSDPDPNIRSRTLKQLDALHLPRSEMVPILTTCLSDSDPRVRAFAALRLGSFSIAASDAVPALKQLASADTDDLVRSRANDALFNIRLYDFPFHGLTGDVTAD